MENKTGKYFKYAIGEILLVVIGILIALQVSNWNTSRIDSVEEQKALQSLYSEFNSNKKSVSEAIQSNQNSIDTGRLIMRIINTDIKILKTQNTDRLLFDIFESGNFNSTENSILEILQSSKLQNLKNDTLKKLIFQWSQKKDRVLDNEKAVSSKSDYLVAYLTKRYPLKNIDAFGILNWKKPSTIEVDKYAIFYDLEFENLIDDCLHNLENYNKRLKDLQDTINAIIKNSKASND
jgi:hypothetical protein